MLSKIKIGMTLSLVLVSLLFGIGENKKNDNYDKDSAFEMSSKDNKNNSNANNSNYSDEIYNINGYHQPPLVNNSKANEILNHLPKLKMVFDEYQKAKEIKVFVLALDDDGGYSYGYSYEWDTYENAKNSAFNECNKYKPTYNIKSECKIFAINSTIVWGE